MSSDDRHADRGKSWRGGGKVPAPGQRAAAPKGGWAKRADRSYERAATRYRLKIAAWSALLVALVVGFVVWLVWTPMRTPFLAAAATDYAAPIPPNAWAREDIERFLTLDKAEVLKCSDVPWQSQEQGLRQIRQQLDSAVPGGPRRNLVIVYLSIHGAVNQAGEPCLLPPGASASDSTQWLRLRDLLDELFVKDRPGKPRDNVKKLLVLDCNRMDADWSLGLLYNGFADRLQAVIEEANIPNLVVLNSAGPGQIGWAAPELQGSVFGYFFWQGLKGAADVETTGNGDRIVSLGELYDYLRAHVGQWVRENRSDVQQPMLLPKGADFPLVYAQSREKTVVPDAPPAADPRWSDVASLWQIHDQLRKRVPYRANPLGWEGFQHKLLRLEQLLEAGKAYEEELGDTRKELDSLAKGLADNAPRPQLAAYSLPLARQLGGRPTDEELKQLVAPWQKPAERAAGQSDQKAAAAEPVKAPPGPNLPYGYEAAAFEAWDWFRGRATKEQLPVVLGFVDGAEHQPKVELIEIHFLRLLGAYLDPAVWKTGDAEVRRALAARQLAEQAAAPQDERTLYWVAPLVGQPDQDRRLAEDDLFVGTPEKLAAADRLWAKAAGEDGNGGAYRQAIDEGNAMARALDLRDRAWAEVPYLAQWLLARLNEGAPTQQPLRELIAATHELGTQLDEANQSGQRSSKLESTQKKVDEQLKGIERAFSRRCAQLETAGEDRQTLRDIGTVLGAPLVTGSQRNELREKYFRILSQRISGESAEQPVALTSQGATSAANAEQGGTVPPYLERLMAWDEHPAVAILSRAKGEGGTAVDPAGGTPSGEQPRAEKDAESPAAKALKMLAAQGEEVRSLLKTLPAEAESRMSETTRMLKAPATAGFSAVATRAGRSQADRLVRAAAPLLYYRPWSNPDAAPAHKLRDLDRYYLSLWQAKRVLDDFWGATPGRETSYFLAAARGYLDSANAVCNEAARPRLGALDLSNLLALREKAAQVGIQPKAADLPVMEDEPFSKHRVSLTLAGNLPQGEAAVYLQDPEGREIPLRSIGGPSANKEAVDRFGVPVAGVEPETEHAAGSSADHLEYLVPNDDHLAGAALLQAVALYRGHVYRSSFAVERSTSGVDVAFVRAPYRPPLVTVLGQAWQRASVIFILDCSGSMQKWVPLEGGKRERRLKLAVDALEAILLRLARSDKPYDVGVMLYGHRVGWDPKNPDQLVIHDPEDPNPYSGRYKPRPPELSNVQPGDDVEMILYPRPFTESDRRQVERRLQSVGPMGETPLYLSIIQAMASFPSDAASGPRHVVVITDGVNDQRSGCAPEKMKFRKDLEDELKRPGNQGIHIHIVGFNLDVEDDYDRQGLEDLKALAAVRGVALYRVQDPSELLKTLEKSLGLLKYVVLPARGGPSMTPQPLELGTPCTIDQPPGRKAAYVVRLLDPEHPAQAEVVVEGGESLELYVSEDPQRGDRRLVYRRYDADLRGYRDKIIDPADPQRRCYVGAHLPEWLGGAVRFPISVQNQNAEQFSPRPAEAWVQIQPHPKDAVAGKTYAFYDLSIEPERPVPVLSCLAQNWPQDAKEAEIQLWCKFAKTDPDKVVSLASLRQAGLQLEDPPGVTLEAETKPPAKPDSPYQVIVTERHPPGSELYTLKVEMDPAPAKVIHRFNPEAGIVRHVFFYDDATGGEMGNYHLRLTTRKRLMEQAVTLREPLVVTIPRATVPLGR